MLEHFELLVVMMWTSDVWTNSTENHITDSINRLPNQLQFDIDNLALTMTSVANLTNGQITVLKSRTHLSQWYGCDGLKSNTNGWQMHIYRWFSYFISVEHWPKWKNAPYLKITIIFTRARYRFSRMCFSLFFFITSVSFIDSFFARSVCWYGENEVIFCSSFVFHFQCVLPFVSFHPEISCDRGKKPMNMLMCSCDCSLSPFHCQSHNCLLLTLSKRTKTFCEKSLFSSFSCIFCGDCCPFAKDFRMARIRMQGVCAHGENKKNGANIFRSWLWFKTEVKEKQKKKTTEKIVRIFSVLWNVFDEMRFR